MHDPVAGSQERQPLDMRHADVTNEESIVNEVATRLKKERQTLARSGRAVRVEEPLSTFRANSAIDKPSRNASTAIPIARVAIVAAIHCASLMIFQEFQWKAAKRWKKGKNKLTNAGRCAKTESVRRAAPTNTIRAKHRTSGA